MANGQQGNIALATVIEFSIQRTYHELMILSELLPRKTDMERKIEIVQFAHRTRQLFVRLLALVKWAKNGCKIDKCMAISNYLDQQARLYIDTADGLSKLARNTLVQARLPAFSIPVAVDVLTSGTYPRLPTCIRDKIIPPDAITPEEEASTLKRLTQIIEYRLVTSDIPRAFKQLTAYDGRVKLLVDKEFSATLTVMGDYATLPWRLLGIDILVEDLDSRDGKPLVHEMQISYLHTLVQSRLVDTETPLYELYTVLHAFCQSLQLEVLYSQVQKMMHEQLNSYVNIEKYIPCKRLLISYWRPKVSSVLPQYQNFLPAIYKIDIHVDETDVYKPLRISHTPTSVKSSSVQLPFSLKSNQLSVEKILLETIHAWSYVRLGELKQTLEQMNIATDFDITDLPPTLTFKVIKPCMDTEFVRISIDCQLGTFTVSLTQLSYECKVLTDLQQHLNLPSEQQNNSTIKELLFKLKLWMGLERCRSSIQYVRTACHNSLPLIHSDQHPLSKFGANVLYVKVPLQETLYVVVVVNVTPSEPLTLKHKFYLLPVKPCTYSGDTTTADVSKVYLKPGALSRLDSNALIQANCVHSLMEVDAEAEEVERQRSKESCYFVSQLISVVSQCEMRAEFVLLAEHLWKEGIHHQGLQEEQGGAPCKLTLIRMPSLNGEADELLSVLLQATIRIDMETMKWVVEFIFSKDPVGEDATSSHQCIFTYDIRQVHDAATTVTSLLRDWRGMVKLYNLCVQYNQVFSTLSHPVSLYQFNYKSLQLSYGPSRNYLVIITWQDKKHSGEAKDCRYDIKFTMCRTTHGESSQNPHNITAHFLELLINRPNTSLAQFMQVLCETVTPLAAIQQLPEIAAFGLQHSSKVVPQPVFTILVHSPTYIKIGYRQCYVIDIILCENNRVMVKDGAYGLFDTQGGYATYTPAPGLKAFLTQYEDSDPRLLARSTLLAEEEHPPTPSNLPGLDTLDALLGPPTRPSPHRQDPSPKPTFQGSVNSPTVAPSPLGGFGSPLDIQMTSPALPMNSPANIPAPSPSSNILAASPGLLYHPQGTPQGLDSGTGFPNPSPKSSWLNSPAAAASSNYTLSPRAAGISQTSSSPRTDQLAGRRVAARSTYNVPTFLSHSSLAKMLSSKPISRADNAAEQFSPTRCCPLERFLGSAQLKRHLSKILGNDIKDKITLVTSGVETGTISWIAESLQYKVFMNNTSQGLQLSVTHSQDQSQPNVMWTSEELSLLERFFVQRVACAPYKQNNMLSFCRMTATPAKIIKDFIRIIRKQLFPDLNTLWRVEWCLTLPRDTSRRIEKSDRLETGIGAMIVQSNKILYVLKFIRNSGTESQGDMMQFSAPFVYEIGSDVTQLADKTSSNRPDSSFTLPINQILQNIRQQQANYQQQHMTAVYASCQEICSRLVLPTNVI